MDNQEDVPQEVVLSGKEKKYLRGLGHHLDAKTQIGREGITPAVLKSTEAVLKVHELVKVKLGQNCPVGKKEAAEQLARQTGSALVQLIGKTVILYRPNKDLPKDKRISL
ncbi:MAG TPA: ribosome assembly RNA-binding protein YhbY [Desulfobulbus sp.]|nr:ribosome assembly RNA-binding protein YhbY [Desulfobulbus sp.]